MIRFHLATILKQRKWTPYRLAKVTGLTVPAAYRLADPEQEFGRFTADTLDRLCSALRIQPGALLEWTAGAAKTATKTAAKTATKTATKTAAKAKRKTVTRRG